MVIITMIAFGAFKFITKPMQVLDRVTDPDHIISSYEEFHNMYNTCKDICSKMEALEGLSEDATSGGFSVVERKIALKQNLSRWVNEYNSKSAQITRSLWKGDSLPHTLNINEICVL